MIVGKASTPAGTVLDGQVVNPSKFSCVVRNQGQTEAKCVRRTKQIVCSDHGPTLFELALSLWALSLWSCATPGKSVPNRIAKVRPSVFIMRFFTAFLLF